MTKRRATLFILSFVCLVLISTWLFAARIASLLIPPLLSGPGIQIESLQIASVGFRSIKITHLAGQNRLTNGIVTYDMENASVTYDFFRMLPKHVEIERAVEVRLVLQYPLAPVFEVRGDKNVLGQGREWQESQQKTPDELRHSRTPGSE